MRKMRKGFVAFAAALTLGMGGVHGADAQNGYVKQKVVYHINELDAAHGALRNIGNHLNAVGDKNIDLVVVTHSKGATFLVEGTKDSKGNSFDDAVASLANRGVRFQFCSNTIRGLKIDENKISPYAEIVPSGVAHVAHMQQQGYLYVKP